MSYMALYRKFRPESFDDVKGQDHIVKTLQNQITAGRIGHAYLFCGTRGTGKTTIAKIFARAVNCEAPVQGSPCGACASCTHIAQGASLNVIEIDAASNNGVDDVRKIRDEIAYGPTEGRYKVYIIDEAHMLSTAAFNALLKTLEEPPEYVIFILATTEAHKIPVTILSRCQRYDFQRITADTIAARMRELMDKEKVEVEDRAIDYIARMADGSMRDALSLLDQCIAFYLGETLTYEGALRVLGAVDATVFSEMLKALHEKDVTKVMSILQGVIDSGGELSQFVTDLTWYIRNILLVQGAKGSDPAIDLSQEQIERLKAEAEMFSQETLLRYIRILSSLTNELRSASQKRVTAEVAFIRLCVPESVASGAGRAGAAMGAGQTGDVMGAGGAGAGGPGAAMAAGANEVPWDEPVGQGATANAANHFGEMQRELMEKIAALEEKIERLEKEQSLKRSFAQRGNSAEDNLEEEPIVEAKPPEALPDDVKEFVKKYREIAEAVGDPYWTHLEKAKVTFNEKTGCPRLVFSDKMDYEGVAHKKDWIEARIAEKIGKTFHLELECVEDERKRAGYYNLLDMPGINMEVEVEEMEDE